MGHSFWCNFRVGKYETSIFLGVILSYVTLGGMNKKMYSSHKLIYFEWMDGRSSIFDSMHTLCGCDPSCSYSIIRWEKKIFTLNFCGFLLFWDCRALSDLLRYIWGRDRSWYQSSVECAKFLCIHHFLAWNAFDWIWVLVWEVLLWWYLVQG